jgi:hypothetical protein
MIRESFRDRGIWPVNGEKIVDKLASKLVIPDLYAPDLRAYRPPNQTPSPPPDLRSSSVENTPPKSIEALEKNQAKISRKGDDFTPKVQRDIARLFSHQRILYERLMMTEETIGRIRATQEPLRRPITRRQVKPLSQNGILTVRDANRIIATRKEKEAAAEERKRRKEWKLVHGTDMPQRPQEDIDRSIESARLARERGDLFFIDN